MTTARRTVVRAALLVAAAASAAPVAAVSYSGGRLTAAQNGCPASSIPTGAAAQPATEIAYDVPLKDAAAANMLTLTAKGGGSGDQVAVDVVWKPLRDHPVVVTVRLELVGNAPGVVPDAARVESLIEGRLRPQRASNGTEVRFDVQVKARAPGTAPTPGYHQIFIVDDANQGPHIKEDRGKPNDARARPLTGCWPLQYQNYDMALVYAHETLHLTGLDDRADAVVVIAGKRVVAKGVTPGNLPKLRSWLRANGYPDPTKGYDSWSDALRAKAVTRQPRPGHENDIMAGRGALPTARVLQQDLDRFVAIAGVSVKGSPGDVVVNKNPGHQNFVVGAPFDLFVPKGGRGHVDGLVVYCLDFDKTFPPRGDRFDVLGSAATLGLPGMAQVQAVAAAAGRLQPGPLQLTPGAQEAVWRITDNMDPDTPEAIALLASVGIAADAQFPDTPHLGNPNAASPATSAVTTTSVLPAMPAAPTPKPPRPALSDAIVMPAVLPARRRTSVRLLLDIAWAGDRIGIAVLRGRRTVVRFPARPARVGISLRTFTLPKLEPGALQLRLTGAFGTQTLAFKVGRGKGGKGK